MMRGVPVQVIQKWLGHANITTTDGGALLSRACHRACSRTYGLRELSALHRHQESAPGSLDPNAACTVALAVAQCMPPPYSVILQVIILAACRWIWTTTSWVAARRPC